MKKKEKTAGSGRISLLRRKDYMENSLFLVEYESGEMIRIDVPLNSSISIGRETINNIVLDDPTVSRSHCSIIRNSEGLFIKDENSTNGTSVNDYVLKHDDIVPLNDGDLIRIAKCLYVLRCMSKGKDFL